MKIHRIGARLSAWNDKRLARYDRFADAPRIWRNIDRLAGWLYIR